MQLHQTFVRLEVLWILLSVIVMLAILELASLARSVVLAFFLELVCIFVFRFDFESERIFGFLKIVTVLQRLM